MKNTIAKIALLSVLGFSIAGAVKASAAEGKSCGSCCSPTKCCAKCGQTCGDCCKK